MKSFLLLSTFTLASFFALAGDSKPTITHYRYPTLFTPNAGQWNNAVRFAIQEGSDNAAFYRNGFTIIRRG